MDATGGHHDKLGKSGMFPLIGGRYIQKINIHTKQT
jgi:hypothetical protein